MKKVTIEEIDRRIDSATVTRPLTAALDASNVAINYYELAPGDSFAYGYHAHEMQEEVFIVLSGTVSFETENGETVVETGEAIRFAPGSFSRGTNGGRPSRSDRSGRSAERRRPRTAS